MVLEKTLDKRFLCIDLVPSKLELSSYTNYGLELGFLWVHCFIFCCENVSFAFHLPFQVPPFKKPLSTVSPFLCTHFFFKSLSHVLLFAIPWTIARQASLFMGIFQARILEWIAMPSSRGSSHPRDRTQVSRIAGGFFTS